MDEQFFFDTAKIFEGLNPQQRKAVNCLNGPLLIMAGAGSGKTRVLTCRIANLIAGGVSPWSILAITFTNKAANEMKSRAEKLIGTSAREVWLSTFHSFCARVLRREIEITGEFNRNFAIFTPSDTKTLIKQCINELQLEEKTFWGVQSRISSLKNELVSCDECTEEATGQSYYATCVAQIYTLYQKKLRENNALDFDDLLFTTVNLFHEYPDVLEEYQERFQYISVDEYQDTNVAQYVLTKQLAQKYKNLCVVGDADQSIYGWRGADIRNIMNFEHDYPNATVIKLEQNYRSTKFILQGANAVIEHNENRKPKNLWTEKPDGEKIILRQCRDDLEEAEVVAREIQRLITQENLFYSDIAILYRTNAQSRLFEEKFMQLEIPYVIIAGLKFYDRKEIRDIVAYLHVIANPRDDLHLMRIINTPRRKIGSANLNRLTEFASQNGLSILELVSNSKVFRQITDLTPTFRASIKKFAAMMVSFNESAKITRIDILIDEILNESGYYAMLDITREENKHENLSRRENLGTFINSAKEFLEINKNATLQDFLNHVALITDMDEVDEQESRVKLMTVHAAKGLEFPAVFVVGMEDGLFPHYIALDKQENLEEERRACYVAMTRAEKKLYITAADSRMLFGNKRTQKISRFVEEIPYECIKGYNLRVPKTHFAKKSSTSAQKKSKPASWRVGDMLNHKMWGMGTVMANDGQNITVQFSNPKIGIKKLRSSVAPVTKI